MEKDLEYFRKNETSNINHLKISLDSILGFG